MANAIHQPTRMADERRFFFVMSLVIFATAIAGFGSDILLGRAWFTDFPWQVHVHAVVFTSWIVLYVVQNWLVVDATISCCIVGSAGSAQPLRQSWCRSVFQRQ